MVRGWWSITAGLLTCLLLSCEESEWGAAGMEGEDIKALDKLTDGMTIVDVQWRSIELGQFGAHNAQADELVVIRDWLAWSFFYHSVHKTTWETVLKVPLVGFKEKIVVAALLSTRPNTGYLVNFEGAKRDKGNLGVLVLVKETIPSNDYPVEWIDVTPYALAEISVAPGEPVLIAKNGAGVKVGREIDFPTLLREDLFHRTPDELPLAAGGADLDVNDSSCPLGSSAIYTVSIDGFFDDDVQETIGRYCSAHGRYWVAAVYPGKTEWFGPMKPGDF